MNLIFIFSLPRSGSTLLQRLLMKHPEICSVSEPWLLLPLAYTLPEHGAQTAPYNYQLAQRAIKDMVQALPNKEVDYYKEVSQFVSRLYQGLCHNNEAYFLDKTPRYYLIINFIETLFPDAKFIFLFRNPMAILSSVINTWSEGRLGQLHQNHVDLYEGPKLLLKGRQRLEHKSIQISYEKLVSYPIESVNNILEYLGLDPVGEGLMGLD